jgi:hypothetical protein
MQRQAGTLSKSILEAVMKLVATCVGASSSYHIVKLVKVRVVTIEEIDETGDTGGDCSAEG